MDHAFDKSVESLSRRIVSGRSCSQNLLSCLFCAEIGSGETLKPSAHRLAELVIQPMLQSHPLRGDYRSACPEIDFACALKDLIHQCAGAELWQSQAVHPRGRRIGHLRLSESAASGSPWSRCPYQTLAYCWSGKSGAGSRLHFLGLLVDGSMDEHLA